MFWADIIAKNLPKRDKYIVADGKTPSGKVHVGSLRGVLVHDFVYKALLEKGKKSDYLYYFDDFDPMDGLPVYLDKEKYEKYMGVPLKDIPAPEGKESFAHYYAQDFLGVFEALGAKPKILYTSQLYKSGKFDPEIRISLDNAEKIQEIYHRVSGSQKQKGWLPFQPVCPKCGKIGTTQASNWDGKEVEFSCQEDLVEWARGCGYKGKVSPFGGTGKMPWKVEWPSKWFVLGTNVEGAGKDHSSAGGTREVANTIFREVFGQEPPTDIPYEHILFGGKKMSSSKGLGSSASEVAAILPPEIIRFLFARVPYQRAIDFDPSEPETIPDLFDEFDRGQAAYFSKSNVDLAKTWQASQIGVIKEEFNLRFSQISERLRNLKTNQDILTEAEKLKTKPLTPSDKVALEQRIGYVKIWLEKFAPQEKRVVLVKEQAKLTLSDSVRKYLKQIDQELEKDWKEEELQNRIYQLSKENELSVREGFQILYKSLIGQDQGPRVSAMILEDKSKARKALRKQYE